MYRYVAKDAHQAQLDWEHKQAAIAAAEAAAEYEAEYYYYDDGSGSGDYESSGDEEITCRPCDGDEDEVERPRFFFNLFTTRNLPCCETRQAETVETTTMVMGPMMKNATKCGRKSYQRILNGVVTKENEFPWQCALLRPDESFYGCSAILLSCDPVIIVTAAHCFRK